MDVQPQLPVVDLSGLDDEVVEALVRAAETFGFFQVVNHGLPVELLEELKESVHRFHGQPDEEKAVYLSEVTPSPQMLYASKGGGDLLDYFMLGNTTEEDALKYWPEICKEVCLKYLKASSKLAERILQLLLSNLGVTVDESMIDAYMGEKDLIMNYYPAYSGRDKAVAARTHSDPGTLTVLLQDDVGGLFGKLEEDGDLANNYKGEWVEIKPVPGALVILVGDSLEVLSNGKYRAGEHYVEAPPGTKTRVSFPVFMTPKSTAKIRPLSQVVEKDGGKPRYKEFVYGDYKMNAKPSTADMKPIHAVQILST